MNILAVIPARGGSKGIPKKNIRLMRGEPLISYAIKNSLNSKFAIDTVVTTDDDEIAQIARHYNANIVMRDKNLAEDSVTLDPVIYDATVKMEKQKDKFYDIVITLQPTSPLLSQNTLDSAIKYFIENDYDTIISAVNKPHLSWGEKDSKIIPMYKTRLNRQQLPKNYLETGAFLITKRNVMTEKTRIGNNVSVYEMLEEESTDIDSKEDWMLCESLLNKKKIVLRCDGYKKIGMGHIYHCLTLGYALTGHEVIFVTNEKHKEGLKKIQDSYMKYITIQNDQDFFNFLKNYKPDIVVNDCLDTEEEYMKQLKKLCKKVITIEDVGDGAKYADIAINALYNERKNSNEYCGEKYVCLRNEFLLCEPKEFRNKVENILVLFGGTDPSNLTKKIYKIAKKVHQVFPNIQYTFITGIGYNCKENELVSDEEYNIQILNNINNISYYMQQADIAFTSQGRTVYELASLGIPSIVLAQNERELLHTFAQMPNGFMNLGLGKEISEETIKNTLEWLIQTPQIREEMRNLMLKSNLKEGLNRELELILN